MNKSDANEAIAKKNRENEQLKKKLESTLEPLKKVEVIKLIVANTIYNETLEAFIELTEEEYCSLKPTLKKIYDEKKAENEAICASFLKGEKIVTGKHTFELLKYYKDIIKTIKVYKNQSKIKLIA